MPEEINRLVTDSITNWFFTTSKYANENLLKMGIEKDRIFFVGNTMIDTLLFNIGRLRKPVFWENEGLEKGKYYVVTMHRPNNVDGHGKLVDILRQIVMKCREKRVVFPAHPRTRKMLEDVEESFDGILIVEPLGYLEFNYLVKNAFAVITDSGGITEETTVMGIPCLTLRDNTERPETVHLGTNELIGSSPFGIGPAMDRLLLGKAKETTIPEKWDGHAAERIVDKLVELLIN